VMVEALRHRIESWKNEGKTPQEVQPTLIDPIAKRAREIYRLYEAECLKANAVDFGDLLLHTVTLLSKHAEVRQTLQRRWSHILVDEYQDTNPVQYQLLKLLVTPQHSFTAVGDDDQSIYRWRGADVGNILRFERDFPGATVIRLEENYRSTAIILEAANHVIAHNSTRLGKTLFTRGERGHGIKLRIYPSEREEGDAIGDTILDGIEAGKRPQAFAVLYRTNAQSRPIEDALRRRRLPYVIVGGVRFYDRKEVKDALAYLKLLANPRSDVDFLRVVNAPARGIGEKSLNKLTELATAKQLSLFEASTFAASGEGDIPTRARTKLGEFVQMMNGLLRVLPDMHPARFVESVLQESGYWQALQTDHAPEAEDRMDNLRELVTAVDEFAQHAETPTLTAFLEEAALATDLDSVDPTEGQVTLMTLHAAKGLEFPVVFMPGLEEGLFPHSRSLEERAALEEERRLCYVGITRARDDLWISAAMVRSVFGETRRSELSRFLVEIPDALLDLGASPRQSPSYAAPEIRRRREQPDEPLFDDLPHGDDVPPIVRESSRATLGVGSRVRHATFGEGRVLDTDGAGERQKLTVEFPVVGRKIIVARFVERV